MYESLIDLDNLRLRLSKETVDKIDFSGNIDDIEVYSCIDDILMNCEERKFLPVAVMRKLREEIFNSLKRMDVLQNFLDDDEITEIMINGRNNIFIEKAGRIIKTDAEFESEERLNDIIQQIVASCNRSVNEANPIQDARINGARVNITLPPVSLTGPIVTIRRFPKEPITMKKLISMGSVTDEAAGFLQKLVEAKYNIFISGGTGSGKTTFLNALSQYIPKDERVITIEDSAELQILGIKNLVRLETRGATGEDGKNITMRDLIKCALRMRPDRVVIGEVRGAEALDMLQAMNTGHDGSLSTGHSNSPKDMISRLETMVLMGMDLPLYAVRGQIASGIDIIIHLSRLRDKSRKVMVISEVLNLQEGEVKMHDLYRYENGKLQKKEDLINVEKLKRAFSDA